MYISNSIVKMKRNYMNKRLLQRIGSLLSIITLLAALIPASAFAAAITARSVTIGSSVASASTTYSFAFTVPSTTAVKSVAFLACTTASGTCTTPSGFSITGSSLSSQPTGLGSATGWSANTATAGSLRITHATNSTAPSGSQTVSFSSVTNPSATNATYFFRITTYSDSAWTTSIDTGTVATSTAGQAQVTATVDETLTFTMAASSVPLGTLSSSVTASGTSTMTASTNAASGYAITVNGTTLQSGASSIAAITTAGGGNSVLNTSQFGINLMANATPSVGTNVSGTGTGAAATNYNTADKFRFVTGETVASATAPTNSNTYTVSYIANIAGSTPAGSYSTLLTYVATSNY